MPSLLGGVYAPGAGQCLDLDVLELCIRNVGDIRNDREDNRTRAFQKAAHTQLWEKLIIGSSSKIPKPELFFVPLFQIMVS